MSIHITRGNMLYGTGKPTISAEYYGQTYIDTGSNPRAIWVATGQNNESWNEVSQKGHKHTVSDFSDLIPEITKIVQDQGIEAALIALKGGNNMWEGDWNNFTGALRVGGAPVLSTNSSIGELKDVTLGENLKVNTLLGWNGSTFVPYEVTGASPSEGGIDFSQYVRKDELVSTLDSSASDRALAASAGKTLLETMKAKYSPIEHTHTNLAPANHKHENYLDKTINQTMTGSLVLDTDRSGLPLSIRNSFGRLDFQFPTSPTDSLIIATSGNGGTELNDIIFGGVDGNTGGSLTLNFGRIHVPAGQMTIGDTKRYLGMPALKISEPNLTYVGNLNRKPAIDINGGAMNGIGQLVFRNYSSSRDAAILFPRNYAGSGQPTESGYYHYLRMSDGELLTDTALSSEQSYISFKGVRIFFSVTDPGKAGREGDIWIKI